MPCADGVCVPLSSLRGPTRGLLLTTAVRRWLAAATYRTACSRLQGCGTTGCVRVVLRTRHVPAHAYGVGSVHVWTAGSGSLHNWVLSARWASHLESAQLVPRATRILSSRRDASRCSCVVMFELLLFTSRSCCTMRLATRSGRPWRRVASACRRPTSLCTGSCACDGGVRKPFSMHDKLYHGT